MIYSDFQAFLADFSRKNPKFFCRLWGGVVSGFLVVKNLADKIIPTMGGVPPVFFHFFN